MHECAVAPLLCFPLGLIYILYNVYVVANVGVHGGLPTCLRVTLVTILCSIESI